MPIKIQFTTFAISAALAFASGAQAAPALVNARLFTDAGRKVPGIQAFLDLED